MRHFRIQIYNKAWSPVQSGLGTRVAEMSVFGEIEIDHRLNTPQAVQFQVPRAEPALASISIGKVVRVLKDGVVKAAGVIAGPLDKEQFPYVDVHAFGFAELLNWNETPWRFELKSTQATSQIREMLPRYRFFRQNTSAVFNQGTAQNTEVIAIASSTIPATDAWHVVLATVDSRASGTVIYAAGGTFIAEPISMASPAAFNRLRYEAHLGNATDIDVQVRSAKNVGGNPSLWTGWSASQQRATRELREELGITTFAVATPFDFVQPRFIFSTNDTIVSPALRAFEVVGEYDSYLSIGSLSLPTNYQKRTPSLEPQGRVIRQIVESLDGEFTVTAGMTLHVKPQVGTNRVQSVGFNVDSDTNVISYEEDDDGLINSIQGLAGSQQGLGAIAVYAESTTSQRLYGVRTGHYQQSIGTSVAGFQPHVNTKVNDAKDPLMRVEAEYVGSGVPAFDAGDTLRFRIPARGISSDLRVQAKRWMERDEGEVVVVEFENQKYINRLTQDLGESVPVGITTGTPVSALVTAEQKSIFRYRNLDIDGQFAHKSGGKFGVFGTTPTTLGAAFIQTYSASNHTHNNFVSADVSATAASQATPWGYSTQAQADDIVTQINNIRVDLENLKQVVNGLVDDLQRLGGVG